MDLTINDWKPKIVLNSFEDMTIFLNVEKEALFKNLKNEFMQIKSTCTQPPFPKFK